MFVQPPVGLEANLKVHKIDLYEEKVTQKPNMATSKYWELADSQIECRATCLSGQEPVPVHRPGRLPALADGKKFYERGGTRPLLGRRV
jgi:hypothetical protein